jgi:hypothetical protein
LVLRESNGINLNHKVAVFQRALQQADQQIQKTHALRE